jgi:hypothetical protein
MKVTSNLEGNLIQVIRSILKEYHNTDVPLMGLSAIFICHGSPL